MTLEEDIFSSFLMMEEKLIHYGFCLENGELVYTKLLPQDNLKIIVKYDGTIHGKIIDLAVNDDYTNFRRKDTTGYSAGIRQKFIDLLLDIRDKCCRNQYFKSEQARRVNNYIYETYDGTPDFLWPNIPSYGAYRLADSKKWYAIIGSVPFYKLDHSSNSRQEVEVINVKVDSDKIKDILAQKGYYPAFHMNKKCWVSIILDDTLGDSEIQKLVDASHASV